MLQDDLDGDQPVPSYLILGSVELSTFLFGIWATESVGVGVIICVVVAVMVGLGSGTVRMSGDVTWLVFLLVVEVGLPAGLEVRLV